MPPKQISKVANSGDVLECSVHTLPKPLVREFHHVFAEKYLRQSKRSGAEPLDILAIPTNQRARVDLVHIGEHVEQEKDRLLNTVSFFFRFD
jgi:hypothetical protein